MYTYLALLTLQRGCQLPKGNWLREPDLKRLPLLANEELRPTSFSLTNILQ
jgi:hypothetical protein